MDIDKIKYYPSFIKKIWVLHNKNAVIQKITGSMVGDGRLELVFVNGNGYRTIFGDQTQNWGEGIYLGGHIDRSLHLEILPNTKLTFVKMEPWAARLISNFNYKNSLNHTIPLSEINANLNKKLEKLRTDDFNYNMLLTLYQTMDYNMNNFSDYKLIKYTSQFLENNFFDFKNCKKNLLSEIGLSQRSLETKFGTSVGLTPLKFANTIRFRKISEEIFHFNENDSLTNLAYKYGYFDQSHFIRTCNQFIDLAPTGISKENCFITNPNDPFRYYTI